jgi:hypothetical protein
LLLFDVQTTCREDAAPKRRERLGLKKLHFGQCGCAHARDGLS